MIKILFRNGFRSLVKQIPYSFVNILGLTIGVASVLIIIIWISVETSFDKFHKDRDQLYRVGMIMKTPNKEINSAEINAPAGPEFKKEFPVVENMVRFELDEQSVIYNDKITKLQVIYTDSTFFDMFSFDLVAGNKQNCLNSPQGIVLTEKTVKRIFGSEDPLGKGILISGETFTVTAVAKDPPVNTNMQFECLAPLSVIARKMHIGWDGGLSCYTYLKLVKGTDPVALEKHILEYMEGAINKKYREFGYALNPYLQKIGDIHLYSEAEYELGDKGSLKQIFVFSGIGLLILLIACFNFVNISTALSFRRAKEVSIMKIFGSDKKYIILFFFIESAIAILVSLFLAFLLVKILLPLTSGLIGEILSLSALKPISWLLIYFSLFIFCTVFASFYSSFYLSSINPLALLSSVNSGKRKQFSRNILVTFQYSISIALIISCLVIYSQMQFVKKSDKGFNEKNILLVNLNSKTAATYELILNRLSSIPGVTSVSVSAGGEPGVGFFMNGYLPEGVEKPMLARAVYVDENYLKTMEISLIDGRDFRNIRSDGNKVIINQTFAKILGWNQSVGKSISRNGTKYEVIGVVKDFNTSSLYNKTEPIFISTVNEVGEFEKIVIKYLPSNLKDVLKSCESILKEINPDFPFDYEFLEDSMSASYSKDQKTNLLFLVLSVIAIFISSLGLFGLATFATQSRMKEISILKINGATISDVFRKFNLDLLKWILISFIIATPIGYYSMTKWLTSFAYKTTISIWLLICSCLFTLAIGLLTVSWAANKAARTNPAETLRKD
jgi:ABC-type transport system, involved in lipoprotein release, permease component